MKQDHYERVVRELQKMPGETPWFEFKESNSYSEMVGELIAGLSNSAALAGKDTAWLVWGIKDKTHEIVGTTFEPSTAKKGNQDLESWLVQMLRPRIRIQFHCITVDGFKVVMLEIPAAYGQPTAFAGREMIRISEVLKPLSDVPQTERDLWRSFDVTPYEQRVALTDTTDAEVLDLLDFTSYFELIAASLPSSQTEILKKLADEKFIRKNAAGAWDISNLGAILFAKNIELFPTISRKSVRLIVYEGKSRIKTKREQTGRKGYAIGFKGLMEYLKALLPENEVIGTAFRERVSMYPELSMRELIANALIHQDFSITGSGPMVEIFDDRVEITNPGAPLGDIQRLLDQAPRSRNENLAAFMRRIGLCEERGSGVDKVVAETEFYQLPPPRWEISGEAFRAVMFAHKELNNMDKEDRIHACYLHACLKFVMRETMTNTTLRERFGIEERNSATASRVISTAVEAGVIKPYDPDQGKRNARYVPYWA